MKYIVILGDGMADRPMAEFNNKTPLDIANKPYINKLASLGEVGMVRTCPEGMKPGSDVCNLSIMGYNPKTYYTGRSSIEAMSMGIDLKEDELTYRCNLVTLSSEEKLEDKFMVDYSAGEISTEEARELISALKNEFDDDNFTLYSGISYRHCLVSKIRNFDSILTPPHDISGKNISQFLPKNDNNLLDMIKKSEQILKNHPVNLKRIKDGKRPATHCWFWGMGTKPTLPDFTAKTGLKGAVISAVDLVKGIAVLSKMENISVPNVTGDIDTNFLGKAEYALNSLKNNDFIYIHMEAPDECGHRGQYENKVKSIELIDQIVVKKIVDTLNEDGIPFTILITPDHPTPISIKTHASEPIPYVLYSNVKNNCTNTPKYTEKDGEKSGIFIENGYTLIDRMINYAK